MALATAIHYSPEDVLRHLYPTLLECFGIIFIGYILGRFNCITPSQGRGIGKFVTMVALPAVIFQSLAKMKFGLIDWNLWGAICLSKTLVFILVASVSLLFGKHSGKAGIYGIFVTQSNDLALGLPLFTAIYETTHPELIKYIYLLIPVSVGILNPIGFSMLEYHKAKSDVLSHEIPQITKILRKALMGFITNPLVFTVVLGLIGNVVFEQSIPAVLEQFLNVLSSSFGASALFVLGLSMVGKMKKYTGYSLVVPLILIIMKSLFLPLLMREAVTLFSHESGNSTNTDVHSTFAFLYGTLPTAPPVVVFAASYGCEVDTVASSMVLGTVLALPIMLVSSIMMSVKSCKASMDLMQVISNMSFDICFLGIFCCIWVCAVFLLVKVVKKVPQRYTFCIIICQALMSLSVALTRIPFTQQSVSMIIAGLFVIGQIGSHCWVVVLAFSLYMVRSRGENAGKQNGTLIMVLGWSVPIITALILVPLLPKECLQLSRAIMLFDFRMHTSFNAATVVVLIASIIFTIVCLALLIKHDKYCRCRHKSGQSEEGKSLLQDGEEPCSRCKYAKKLSVPHFPDSSYSSQMATSNDSIHLSNGESPSNLIRDRMHSNQSYNSLSSSDDSTSLIDVETNTVKDYYEGEKHQLSRHVIFILIMTLVGTVNLFLCLWRLLGDHRSGIYLELEFMLALLTFGQGFISFAIFGFHKKLFSVPERISKLFTSCKRKEINLTPVSELSQDISNLCDAFKTHHLQQCQRDLAENSRSRLRTFHGTFRGTELIDWLVKNGMSINRQSAVKYGNRLLQGRVIAHITEQHLFYDFPYFYRFCTEYPPSINSTPEESPTLKHSQMNSDEIA